jgi:hypothetical protein
MWARRQGRELKDWVTGDHRDNDDPKKGRPASGGRMIN